MNLSNETYDRLKWITTILLPAVSALIAAIWTLFNLPHGEKIVGVIAAVITFLGALLKNSSANYNGDGTLIVDTTSDPSHDIYSIAIDDYPEVLAKKDTVMLKVVKSV